MSTDQLTASKRCSKCKVIKPLDDFGIESRRPDGHRCFCKSCGKPERRAYSATSVRFRTWYQTKGRVAKLASKRKQLYGLNHEDYTSILKSQGGVCAICGSSKPGGRSVDQFHVDHDHQTGMCRGILCAKCNTAIGLLGDSVEGLMRAVEYLRRSQTHPPRALS